MLGIIPMLPPWEQVWLMTWVQQARFRVGLNSTAEEATVLNLLVDQDFVDVACQEWKRAVILLSAKHFLTQDQQSSTNGNLCMATEKFKAIWRTIDHRADPLSYFLVASIEQIDPEKENDMLACLQHQILQNRSQYEALDAEPFLLCAQQHDFMLKSKEYLWLVAASKLYKSAPIRRLALEETVRDMLDEVPFTDKYKKWLRPHLLSVAKITSSQAPH